MKSLLPRVRAWHFLWEGKWWDLGKGAGDCWGRKVEKVISARSRVIRVNFTEKCDWSKARTGRDLAEWVSKGSRAFQAKGTASSRTARRVMWLK